MPLYNAEKLDFKFTNSNLPMALEENLENNQSR